MDALLFVAEVMVTMLFSFSPLIVYFVVSVALQKVAFNNFYSCIGYKGVVATGIIGTVLHEFSHYFACIVFGHKVTAISFYQPSNVDGTLGYVEYSYNKKSLYQVIGRFWVGYAPFIFGVFYLWVLTFLLLDLNLFSSGISIKVEDSIGDIIYIVLGQAILDLQALSLSVYIAGWFGVLWVLSTASILLHMMPSVPDIKGSWSGFWIMFIIAFVCFSVSIINFEGDYFRYVSAVFDFSLTLSVVLCQILSILILLVILSYFVKKTAGLIAVLYERIA